ncbi:hypothetical protein GCM10010400_58170 [Streptomyces aculeolatus]|uniref:WhiB family transcriptional regulator n=1 Tax=Streptomyces aculeolatus TaxID=270689 RepID=UPI001CEC5D58|nr:WhiB family transcriptional regulator [Streptomyces aculeolatus]
MKPRMTAPGSAADSVWWSRALCLHPAADPTWWEHDGPGHPDGKKAVTWCRACPAKAACLADAERFERPQKSGERTGIRGGLGVRERAALYRRKDEADKAAAAAQDSGAAA